MHLKKLLLTLAVIAYVKNNIAQNNFTPLDSALIGCYPFSGNTNDASGNNNHGTNNGAVLVADRFGNPNSAYSFNGINQNIMLTNFSNMVQGNEISLSYWATTTVNFTRIALLKVPDVASNRFSTAIYYTPSETYWDYGDIFNNGRLYVPAPSGIVPAVNNWDHWVFVTSAAGGFKRCYKNGVLLLQQNTASTFSAGATSTLLIGGGIGGNSAIYWFNGKLDDVKIYNRVLNQTDVYALYTNSLICTSCTLASIPTNTTPPANLNVCVGNSATLSAISNASLSWHSSAISSTPIASGSVFVSPPLLSSGTFTYYAKASNTCGISAPLIVTVTVNPSPSITITGQSSVCAGTPITLIASGAQSYTWNQGVVNGASFIPTITSVYSVNASNAAGCLNSASIQVTVHSLPTVTLTSGASTICKGNTVVLTYTGNYASAYLLNATGGVPFSPTATNVYSVFASSAGGCTSVATTTIFVLPAPLLTISANTTACSGSTLLLQATGASSYSWSHGALTFSTIVSPTVNTTYNVVGTNSLNCSSQTSINILVFPLPTLTIQGKDSICLGSPINLTVVGAMTYTWNNGSNASSIQIPVLTNTIITVGGTNSFSCSSFSTKSITAVSLPQIGISAINTSICAGEQTTLTASGAASYLWNTGTTSNTLLASPAISSIYTVSGKDAFGCANSSTLQIKVDACLGLKNNIENADFSIYPNPNKGEFNVVISANENHKLFIFNSLGQIVHEQTLDGLSNLIKPDLAKGLYYAVLRGNYQPSNVIKLIVE